MRVEKIKKGMEESVLKYINNREEELTDIDDAVMEIIKNVRKDGDKALSHYSEKFDNVKLDKFLIDEKEIEEAYKNVENEFIVAIENAASNIREFHEKQLEKTWLYERALGVKLGQLVTPMESAGVYIPGGKASYPSTVLMNVIPAKIAGVKRVVMVTPPDKDGKIDPYILAAAKVAGVTEVYAVGGAQSIAALAYGTESIEPVVKITGPGNIYVARAKKMVYGSVSIDMIAGPSEICIIGDENSNVKFVSADMLSQAEHDEMAVSVYITTSEENAKDVEKEVRKQLKELDRVSIATESIEKNAVIFVAEDIDSMFEIANTIAPEHLEVLLKDPENYLDKVKEAGAVFLGEYSPEPLGDYMAGPNHTLPTSGTAKFSSPLGTYDFVKKTSIIKYTKEALLKECDDILLIAEKEGLTAHGRAVALRRE